MLVGDRARLLVSRGINPLAEADLSASARFYNEVLTRRLRRARVTSFTLGCCAVALVGVGFRFQPVTPAETAELATLSRAGVDAEHPLPDDLPARLAVPRADVAGVAAILSTSAQVEPDTSWAASLDGHPVVLPSRVGALQALVSHMARLDPETWPKVITDIRVAVGLSNAARDLLGALRPVSPSDLHQLPRLIRAFMALPPERRQALEQAGFPPVPADAAGQQLYALAGKADAGQSALIAELLRDRDLQRALPRIEALLRSRPARRLLGVLADGIYAVPDLPDAPRDCDIARPGSCRGAR